jgi:hypothetical protein
MKDNEAVDGLQLIVNHQLQTINFPQPPISFELILTERVKSVSV